MKTFRTLAAAAVLGLAATPASAVWISVGGGESINLPGGVEFQIASVYENVVIAPGQILSGVGEIFAINGLPTTSYCSSACELTFRFTNYLATSVTPTQATFTGGDFDVYLAFGADIDFNPSTSASSAADLAAATNGTLLLTLMGHPVDALGNTLIGTADTGDFTTGDFHFFGRGQLDVDLTGAGVANANFDTNTIPSTFGGNADLSFNSSGDTLATSQPHPEECEPTPFQGAECVGGSADIRAFVIPEPGILGLLGMGLLAFGLVRRRRTA